jgi:hypothetical protein
MRTALVTLVALLLPAVACAQTKEQDIDKLLETVQLEKRIDASNRVMRAAFIRGMRNRSKTDNPALHRLIEEEYDATFPSARVVAEVKPQVQALYAERLTQGEIRELTALFSSPVFLKHRELNAEVGRLVVAATQRAVKAGMGDLMKRVMDRAVAEGVLK